MAVALQWHVATNTSDPVALATSRNAETGIGQKDVVIVVCDAQHGDNHDTRLAAGLARDIFDAYAEHEQAASNRTADRIELAQRLSDSIMLGLKRVQHAGQPVAAGTLAPSGNDASLTFSVVATVIHAGQLIVARYGKGDVYLLRAGQLLHLTDAAFAAPHTDSLEPDLGQLDMAGEDRVLLCNDWFSKSLKEGQIKSVLRATPSSRKAASSLLDLAERVNPNCPTALAVADYVTGQTGVFPAVPLSPTGAKPIAGPRRGTFRTVAAALGLLMLVAFSAWAFSTFAGGNNGIPVTPGTSQTMAAPTPAATLMPAIIITPTETAIPSPTVTSTPTETPTSTPTVAPTETPTNTPEPTPTETPVPTRRPTRRPPTATPVPPTATPEPPTATPLPVTDTPVPTSPPKGGGEPAPTAVPCPPGATCG